LLLYNKRKTKNISTNKQKRNNIKKEMSQKFIKNVSKIFFQITSKQNKKKEQSVNLNMKLYKNHNVI
jgi:hypothetical protein